MLETRRTFGGRSKVKAVLKNKGVYALKSQGIICSNLKYVAKRGIFSKISSDKTFLLDCL